MDWKIGRLLLVLGAIFVVGGQRLSARGQENIEMEEENIIVYEIEFPERAQGEEYYTEKPVVKIKHKDERYITKYQMRKEQQEIVSGTLAEMNEEGVLEEEMFGDGVYQLEVWMEDEAGEKFIEHQRNECFKIDTQAPNKLSYDYMENNNETSLISNQESHVVIKAEDEMSGVLGICYWLENDELKFIESEEVELVVPLNYAGTITAYSIDKAGNQGERKISKRMIIENQKPSINVQAPRGFDQWYKEDIPINIAITEDFVSAGIERIHCYINEQLVVDEQIEEPEVQAWNTNLMIKQLSIGNEPIKMAVEAIDRAGNVSTIKKKLYLDKQLPVVSIAGFINQSITAKSVEGIFVAAEENEIASIITKTQLYKQDGSVSLLTGPTWEKDMGQQKGKISLEENGRYQMEMIVTDMAGNVSFSKAQVIIDKKSPVISYVDQLDQKHIKEFQWNYEISDLIQDETSYSHDMKLDGMYYQPGKKITREGAHTLKIKAIDSAGNQAEARAEFVIDHTEPKILVEDLVEEKIYEKGTMIKVKLKDDQDQIQRVVINGKSQKMKKENQFQYIFQEEDTYKILIIAEDLAGNKAQTNLSVRVKSKQSVIEKMVEPIAKVLGKKEDATLEKIREKKRMREEKQKFDIRFLFWIGIVGVVGGGLYGAKKLRP